jgi:hypothetical protein
VKSKPFQLNCDSKGSTGMREQLISLVSAVVATIDFEIQQMQVWMEAPSRRGVIWEGNMVLSMVGGGGMLHGQKNQATHQACCCTLRCCMSAVPDAITALLQDSVVPCGCVNFVSAVQAVQENSCE